MKILTAAIQLFRPGCEKYAFQYSDDVYSEAKESIHILIVHIFLYIHQIDLEFCISCFYQYQYNDGDELHFEMLE